MDAFYTGIGHKSSSVLCMTIHTQTHTHTHTHTAEGGREAEKERGRKEGKERVGMLNIEGI